MQNRLFIESNNGYFGEGEFSFGGCFIPEILHPALGDLQAAYNQIFLSQDFKREYKKLLKHFVGRPTPLIHAKNASKILNNDIYLKFEGLANTGAHKINNALAQALLAKKMGKTKIIAETGAGQHGVAVSSVCAFLGLDCQIFMGELDMQRQRPNVFIMEQFGATVVGVPSGSKTLKDAVNATLREWSKAPNTTFYIIGSALGPYPYPDMVREAQSVIGKEIKKQFYKATDGLPDYVFACVGGGSNAMGAFSAFLMEKRVKLVAVEAGGRRFKAGQHAMRLTKDSPAKVGIAHGYKSYFLQDSYGQISSTHSISAGLDYAGIGPQLAHLASINRVKFIAADDREALEALKFFAKHEGILAALESSHALAGLIKTAKLLKNKKIVVNVSGRGDKDLFIMAKELCSEQWRDFLGLELDSVNKKIKARSLIKHENLNSDAAYLDDDYFLDEADNSGDSKALEEGVASINPSIDPSIGPDLGDSYQEEFMKVQEAPLENETEAEAKTDSKSVQESLIENSSIECSEGAPAVAAESNQVCANEDDGFAELGHLSERDLGFLDAGYEVDSENAINENEKLEETPQAHEILEDPIEEEAPLEKPLDSKDAASSESIFESQEDLGAIELQEGEGSVGLEELFEETSNGENEIGAPGELGLQDLALDSGEAALELGLTTESLEIESLDSPIESGDGQGLELEGLDEAKDLALDSGLDGVGARVLETSVQLSKIWGRSMKS